VYCRDIDQAFAAFLSHLSQAPGEPGLPRCGAVSQDIPPPPAAAPVVSQCTLFPAFQPPPRPQWMVRHSSRPPRLREPGAAWRRLWPTRRPRECPPCGVAANGRPPRGGWRRAVRASPPPPTPRRRLVPGYGKPRARPRPGWRGHGLEVCRRRRRHGRDGRHRRGRGRRTHPERAVPGRSSLALAAAVADGGRRVRGGRPPWRAPSTIEQEAAHRWRWGRGRGAGEGEPRAAHPRDDVVSLPVCP